MVTGTVRSGRFKGRSGSERSTERGRVIGNIGFTRHGQEHLTKLARDIIADDERLYASQQLDESDL